ncbi:MAG: hypothetical protein Fur0020_10300 [Thermodesulfovibrionia bacterium]
MASAIQKEWVEPTVEYSADSYIETGEGMMKAKVYHAQGKERREHEVEGEKSIMIIRYDKRLIWTLIPDAMVYMEIKMIEGSKDNKEDLSNYKIEETVVGEETVNGIGTTKSKIIMTNKKTGERLGGFWWVSKEGIVVKMDAVAVDQGSKTRIKQELKNLKIGKQDHQLFEIPAGYSRMTMPMGSEFNMQDMMKK